MKKVLLAYTRSLLLTGSILIGFVTQVRAYYHPDEGRWLSRDPIGEIAGPNAYCFVGDDPIDLVDPHGLAEGSCSACCLGSDMVNVRVHWTSPVGPYRYALAAYTTYAITESWIGPDNPLCYKDISFLWHDCVDRKDRPGGDHWQHVFDPTYEEQWSVFVYSKIKWKSCEKGFWVDRERKSENAVSWAYFRSRDRYEPDRDIPIPVFP